MRYFLLAVGVFAFAGCSSSTTEDGGTTTGGVATTGGGTTGTHGTTGTTTTTTTTTTTGGTGGLANGAPCGANTQCLSGVCGISGVGNCCGAACSTLDPTCGATACDDTGACSYPSTTTTCGTDTCSSATLTSHACDAAGTCAAATPMPCPNNFACNASGLACNTTCTVLTDCASGFYCSGGACVAQLAVGACTENDACTSGVCGIAGTGHCCTTACTNVTPPCGATDCSDSTGGCVFADVTVSCGAGQSCTGNTQTNATLCDGLGNCATPTTVDCTPFICGPTACLTSCTGNADCTAGDFCDSAGPACCSGLASGGSLNVDGASGNDATACCGIGSNAACQTIGRAMKLIDAAQAQGVTIVATVSGGGGDWTPAGETYPIQLGWGAELSAAGVFFSDPGSLTSGTANGEIFDVLKYSANDAVGYASIVGAAGSQVGIGMNQANDQQSIDSSAIQIETGQILYLANAVVNGSAGINQTTAITLTPGSSLTLGQDQSAGVTGTVNIGNSLNVAGTDGWNGIVCQTDHVGLGCTINDATLVGMSSVVIQGQHGTDMDVEDFSTVSLTSAPVIGLPPATPGFNQCPGKPDVSAFPGNPAVLLQGSATMTFNNGKVQCLSGWGFGLFTSPRGNGNPTLNLDSTTLQNTDLAIYASAGTVTVSNSTVQFNYNGVQQATDSVNNGAIDLSGAGVGGTSVVCSSSAESSQGASTPGVDVYNSSTISLTADNVAWDTTGPDYFSCDTSLTTCTCLITTCTDGAGSDDMDAVEDDTNLGGITTTGNTQSPISIANGCN